MKNLNLKDAMVSSVIVYIIGILAYLGSFLVHILDDPELQANLVLMIAIIPAGLVAANWYYKRGHETNGLIVGLAMFSGAILLDAFLTVPLFIIPKGGNHLSFFGDPGFWLIGLEYIMVIALFGRFLRRAIIRT